MRIRLSMGMMITAVLMWAATGDLFAETGSLQGRVTDSSGMAVAGATVALTAADGREMTHVLSGSNGEFSFPAVLGELRLEVNSAGFKSVKQIVRIGTGILVVPVVLERAASGAETTIGLESNNNLSAMVLDEDFLQSLSDSQSEFESTLADDALSVLIFHQLSLSGPLPDVTGGTEFIVNGMPGSLPLKDQVREVRFDSNPFSSEFSGYSFGRLEVTTPMERERYHGRVTFNFRDESLNSRSSSGGPKSSSQSRNLHGILSGPLPGKSNFSLAVEHVGSENHPSEIRATTLNGPVSGPVKTPLVSQAFDLRAQHDRSPRQSLNFSVAHNSSSNKNLGVGGLTLAERGFRIEDESWEFEARHRMAFSPEYIHEIRFQFIRDTDSVIPVTNAPALNVQGAFNGGGYPTNEAFQNSNYRLEDRIVWVHSKWTIESGLQVDYTQFRDTSSTNLNGTFTFTSLNTFLARQPSLFAQINIPQVTRSSQAEYSGFLQADRRINSRLTAQVGLRYEFQSHLSDYNNVDPRVGFAYRVLRATVLRGGAGVFHGRVEAPESHESGAFTTTVSNPSYPNPFLSGGVKTITPLNHSDNIRATDLAAPYRIAARLSVEHALRSNALFSVSYDVLRGLRRPRVRNINAPYPGTPVPFGITQTQIDQMRPLFPNTAAVFLESSTGYSLLNALTARFRMPDLHLRGFRLAIDGSFILASSKDDNSVPANNYNVRAEWARSSEFPRRTFWTSETLRAPWGLSLSVLFRSHSGFPYNTTTGLDDNRDGSNSDRPSGVERNSGDGPANYNVDLRASKTIRIRERKTATLFGYARNALNHLNSGNPVGTMTSPLFGTSSTIGSSRRAELGLRFDF